jgi:hypothetical protein
LYSALCDRIINGVICGLLNFLQKEINERQMNGNFPLSNSSNICVTVNGMYSKAHLQAYINEGLLWINTAQNRNCSTTFTKGLPGRILRKSVCDVIQGHRRSDGQTSPRHKAFFFLPCKEGLRMESLDNGLLHHFL